MPVGACTSFAIDATHRRAMTGYALAREHSGHGYAQDALRVALAHAFGVPTPDRVEVEVDPGDSASWHRPERMGFTREGVLHERWRVGYDVQESVICGWFARDHAATSTGAAA
jgi:[ribosomal protein S5]-alanine N-acetyltransferase